MKSYQTYILPLLITLCASELLPIVFWHGMGDTCCDTRSMGKVKQQLETEFPGLYIYSIKIGKTEDDDRKASFFGNLNQQVEEVCKTLSQDEKLVNGFNAIGFSQGGQALRAYIERCNSPPVRNLVTFGSQHSGVSDLPRCQDNGWLCRLMRSIASGNVYSSVIQNRVIQAQYFRDPARVDEYKEKCIFLPDINNEVVRNEEYKSRLSSLNKFIMIKFSQDDLVVPAESAWFGVLDEERNVVPLRQQDLYKEDWLGLKALDEEGKLVFLEVEGQHMHFTIDFLIDDVIKPYLIEEGEFKFIKQQ